MASSLRDICFDCGDNYRVAEFWASTLGYEVQRGPLDEPAAESVCIQSRDGASRIWFSRVPEPKVVKSRVHIDINMHDDAELARLVGLGARPLREQRGDDGALWWTVMADPEGNEFCAFPPQH